MTGGDRTARPHPAQPFVSSVSMQMCPFLTEAFHLHGEEGAVKLPCLLETRRNESDRPGKAEMCRWMLSHGDSPTEKRAGILTEHFR